MADVVALCFNVFHLRCILPLKIGIKIRFFDQLHLLSFLVLVLSGRCPLLVMLFPATRRQWEHTN